MECIYICYDTLCYHFFDQISYFIENWHFCSFKYLVAINLSKYIQTSIPKEIEFCVYGVNDSEHPVHPPLF